MASAVSKVTTIGLRLLRAWATYPNVEPQVVTIDAVSPSSHRSTNARCMAEELEAEISPVCQNTLEKVGLRANEMTIAGHTCPPAPCALPHAWARDLWRGMRGTLRPDDAVHWLQQRANIQRKKVTQGAQTIPAVARNRSTTKQQRQTRRVKPTFGEIPCKLEVCAPTLSRPSRICRLI